MAMQLASLLFVFLSTSADDPADWGWLHGPNGNRTTSETVGLRKWPRQGPPRLWRTGTPGGFSSLAVADGKAFTLILRDDKEVCIALNTANGKELWGAPLGNAKYDGGGAAGADDNKGGDGPRSTPSCYEGRVYVLDAHLLLTALDAEDGSEVWRQDLMADHGGRNIRWQNAASPLIADGRVYVAGGGAGNSLLAFDAKSGEPIWATGDERMTHATPVMARIHGVEQVLFLVQAGLVALDPRTGDELWRTEYPYRTSTAASPVVYEDLVYLSAGYGVGAGVFRVEKDGDEWQLSNVWRKRNRLMNHWSTPVCRDGFLYGMFSFKKYGDGPLMCVDMRTGEERWSQAGFGPGNCILVGDEVLALSDTGEIVLVAAVPDEYREIERADVLKGKCWSSPSFSNGQLYVRSTVEATRVDLSRPLRR